MEITPLQQLWKAYLDAYSEMATDERERLLRQSVTDDVVSTNPTGEVQGLANLMEHIRQFQQKSPGAYFNSNTLLAHHGQLLSEWTMFKKDGAKITTAHTYARLNGQGRITHLTGFFTV